MVMFWQISYGLPARVHVTVCPGAGIGGRLHVPAGAARRGLEDAAVAVKAVNDATEYLPMRRSAFPGLSDE